ncbi:peptidoglycan-associated lipoprotein Pal [Novosphingobium lentum]|uniref:peptidoglycan-associated lipoprotein Pal n=1 Tax=Novosphingobium lentum TaxID=145287 RepID=UPI00082FEA61|nr:peptidoglycan-associated lipoprotein Pal [Novosphingobium lentum]
MPRLLFGSRPIFAATVIAGSLALAACGAKAPKQLPPEPGTGSTTTTMPPAGPTAPVPGSQADFVASVASDTIHFDTDRFNIDTASMATLQSQAQWLGRYPAKRVTLEGHCDERGTRDYNIALGERRANSAKNYLVSLGVDAARITTVSYGKERPIALGSDEASWAQNRRAVTVTVQ